MEEAEKHKMLLKKCAEPYIYVQAGDATELRKMPSNHEQRRRSTFFFPNNSKAIHPNSTGYHFSYNLILTVCDEFVDLSTIATMPTDMLTRSAYAKSRPLNNSMT